MAGFQEKEKQTDNVDFLQAIKKSLPLNFSSLNNSHVMYSKWDRAKDKTGKSLKLGGLLGMLKYQILDDNSMRLIPWLAIGQLLQIGNKSSFGLGDYTLVY